MYRTISDDRADLKVITREKTYISAVPTNLCQGKTTLFLHTGMPLNYRLDALTKRFCENVATDTPQIDRCILLEYKHLWVNVTSVDNTPVGINLTLN